MSLSPLVEFIIKSMVSEPDSVNVDARNGRDGVTFQVTVAPNDVGKIIGKNGRVASAIRYVVSAAAAKQRQRAFIKVVTE